MFTTETQLRVRYAETDQMGFVYYGNYPQYFEVARVEALRSLGITYKDIEEDGTAMPVVHLNIDYKKAARYDNLITIKTQIPELPTSKIKFNHEVYNQAGDLLTKAHLILVFVNTTTLKPVRCPQLLYKQLETFF